MAAVAGLLMTPPGSMLRAQTDQGAITGVVTDESNAPVAGVTVTVANSATQVSSSAKSNSQGYYNFPYLGPGAYSITAEKTGFSTARVNDIHLQVGLTATINVTLKVGSVHQEVSVSATAALLEQQSAAQGNVVGSQQILQLPNGGRNPYNLVTQAPGVIPAGNTGTGPIISGGRSNTTDVLLDGAEARNNSTNDIAYTPPLEAVDEIKIITNNYSAEYGRSGGGIITGGSRSGTNEYHGSAYEYFRNDKLNANGWTNNRNGLPLNPVRHNEYGFAVGGPVQVPHLYNGRNKTFVFFNAEWVPDRSPDNIVATVPTAAQRNGDFSQTTTGSGQLIKIYDPNTTVPNPASPGSYTRTAFLNNQIPANRINPNTLSLLQYFPLPNLPGNTNNYATSATRNNNTSRYFGRIDENITDKNRLFFSYGVQYSDSNTPAYTGLAFPGEGTNCNEGKSNNTSQSGMLSDTHAFSSSLVGEFRFSYLRSLGTCTPRSVGFDITKLGLPSYLKTSNPVFPEFDIADLPGPGGTNASLGPQRASYYVDGENTPEAQAQLTWLKGKHSLRGGFEYLFLAFNIFRPDYPSGDFSFGRGYTQGPDPSVANATSGYGVASLLLGVPDGGQITVGPSMAASQKSYNLYIQDDWRILRNLTLNLGVRWEYQTPWTDRYNHLAYFDPSVPDTVTGRLGTQLFNNGQNRYQSDPQQKNIAPRVGFAYSFDQKTVLRGAYGIFYLPSNGGVGASPGDLGSGSETSTPVYLGQPPAAPNTPPGGASFSNPFVTGLLPYPFNAVGNGVNSVFRNWPTPFNQQWNFSLQRTITSDLLIEASYVGSRGEHIWIGGIQEDALNPQYLALGAHLNDLVPNPFYGVITSGALSAQTIRLSQALLPYAQYTSVSSLRAAVGDSIYHALTLRADKRTRYGLQFQAFYTFGKLIDDVPERFLGGSSIINPYNLAQSRSLSNQDHSQIFTANFIYALPFGTGRQWLSQGWVGKVLGNWQVGGIASAETGTPLSISAPGETQAPGLGSYAMRVGNPVLPSGQQSLNTWFNPAAFTVAPLYSFGNDSRTEPNLRNPGLVNLDLSMSRYQPITERWKLQFRADLFNSLNNVNFNGPQNSVTAANFGQITSAAGGRTVQLGLRLSF